jgi:hypothetical protein
LPTIELSYRYINYKGGPKASTFVLLFWGSAQCFKKVGPGPIKVASSKQKQKLKIKTLGAPPPPPDYLIEVTIGTQITTSLE